jgi:hypothetical protein
MDEGLAIIAAAVMAILGIFYTSRQQRKLTRKQHTYHLIERMDESAALDRELEFARSLIDDGKIPRFGDAATAAEAGRLDSLLNTYEVLACGIVSGDVDEALVRRMERLRLCRLYLRLLPYVEDNRAGLNDPSIWENMEYICYRWTVAAYDPFDAAMSTVLLRPSMSGFLADRANVSAALHQEAERIRAGERLSGPS